MSVKELEELHSCQTDDDVLLKAINSVWKIIEQSKIVGDLEVELIVFNQDKASPTLQKSHYATSNCKALLGEHLLVINERFLIEIESVIRAFELSEPLENCPFVTSDDDIFRLVDNIVADPYKYVSRMRKLTNHNMGKENVIYDIMKLTFLFFIGHELGHLLEKVDKQSFTEFVKEGAPLENRVVNAVVKLRRHAEEFKKFGFELPGFERILAKDDEIEQSSAELQNQIRLLNENHTKWFNDEIDADKIGTNILLEHLSAMTSDDAANTCMYRIVRGIFAAALYSWHKDLQTFSKALDLDNKFTAKSMMITMMKNHEQYIHAASLFGNVHRFTLLRAEQLIESVIMKRSNSFDKERKEKGQLYGDTSPEGSKKLRQSIARYILLCSMMDTAVKIAYVGTSTAWLLKKDEMRRTPQLFMMNFESINEAMSRVRRMMDKL